MKVLNQQPKMMTNAEVKDWLKTKRTQIVQEDALDRKAGITPSQRPQNYLNALDRHEEHLNSSAYPYNTNPSAYDDVNQKQLIHKFTEAYMKKLQEPLVDEYKEKTRQKEMTVKEAQDELVARQRQTELSTTEMLTIFNHAPKSREVLQPMIDEYEARFTTEELDALVECVQEILRPDEQAR